MTKQEAQEHKDGYEIIKKNAEKMIDELDAIINSPEPDLRLGNLVWFGDEKPLSLIGFYEGKEKGEYKIKEFAGTWKIISPITREEMESMLYVEPKATRYDWSKAPAWAKYWTTDANGREEVWEKLPTKYRSMWGQKHCNRVKTMLTLSNCTCPDWQDSLEEGPEVV